MLKGEIREVSSGVSTCPNKGRQSDLRPPFLTGPAGRGDWLGPFLRL